MVLFEKLNSASGLRLWCMFPGPMETPGNYAITGNPQLNVPIYSIPLPQDVFHKLRGGQEYTKNAYQEEEESQGCISTAYP